MGESLREERGEGGFLFLSLMLDPMTFREHEVTFAIYNRRDLISYLVSNIQS